MPEERQRKQQSSCCSWSESGWSWKRRQLRLQEELERERVELHGTVRRSSCWCSGELQELQTLKHHVLQQQQEERQAQFALQREQLAQQRLQLEQIQKLQQQSAAAAGGTEAAAEAALPMACEALPAEGLPSRPRVGPERPVLATPDPCSLHRRA